MVDRSVIGPYNKINLSTQMILNCRVGTCKAGGNPEEVYKWLLQSRVALNGCQVYTATSPDPGEKICSQKNICKSCKRIDWDKSECKPVLKYQTLGVLDYGYVKGVDLMKNEILKNGPISCRIKVTKALLEFKGGNILRFDNREEIFIHYVSIVGFGVENGIEFWRARNSWGSMFGDQGYFKVPMHSENFGIEEECLWAIPDSLKTEKKY